ncbi:MAG: hypothetical protein BWY08_01356 [Bacteroidetes bacterium ADurb.Bin174]|nr:MAG: hypothetical protein BWY08_01356 [Bacteroidetes bacterium ADurb.Bin174]
MHQLLGIRLKKDLFSHPKCGASWEGYVIEEVLKIANPDEQYFWRTHNGAEIDLVAVKDGRIFGVECKWIDAPRLTPSMRIAKDDLKLEKIIVVYPGKRRYEIAKNIHAIPLQEISDGASGIF